MKNSSWIILAMFSTLIAYYFGMDQGDTKRRLLDVDMMANTASNEMARHFTAENYWQDKAEDCLAQSNKGGS